MRELTFFLGLEVKQSEEGIFISQDKYVAEILKKFDFSFFKTTSTPIETQKPLVKDKEAADVDVHLYRSMIRSLMYLTASRPDIMFAVCACYRFQVTPKLSHLHAVKRIFRKSTTGGCQFPGKRLISWQCKKHTIVATSTTEAEYVAAANCHRQMGNNGDKLVSASRFGYTALHNLVLPGKVSAAELSLDKFWKTATSQIINDEKQIHAIVDGQIVVITKSSMRRELLFTDAKGITCLINE
nr:hypothetical protein [Tanacetum cinerariifolium]